MPRAAGDDGGARPPAPRPAYSVLRSEKPETPRLPHWREGHRECLARLPLVRILVTGGAAYRSHFVRLIAARGDQAVVLDRLTYSGNW